MKIMEDEFFSRNSELSIEFSKYVLEHPELDDVLNNEVTVIFLPEFDLALKEFNLQIAKELEQEGQKVIYVSIQTIRSRPVSRLEGVEIRYQKTPVFAVV